MNYWHKYCNETEWQLEKITSYARKHILKRLSITREKQQLSNNSAKIADIDK